MKDGEKIEATFEWFVLTVEAGLAGRFPDDIDKRIDFCKKQIEAHKIAKNTEQQLQPENGPVECTNKCCAGWDNGFCAMPGLCREGAVSG